MRHPLDRLLRLRVLLEDVSRLELEARLQELTQVEGVLAHIQRAGEAMRRQSFVQFANAEMEDRQEAQIVSEWLIQEKEIFEKTRHQKRMEVDAAQATYIEHRKECRQVKSVIEAKESIAAIEGSRKEQRELDDWFSKRNRSSRMAGDELG